MSPTRILKMTLLIIVLVLLWLLDPIDGQWSNRLTPFEFFFWLGFLTFCISTIVIIGLDLTDSNSASRRWLPAQNTTLLVIPLYFFGISLFVGDWRPADVAPPGWIAQSNSRMTIYANLKVIEEIRPGLVIAETEWTATEHYTSRWVQVLFNNGRKRKVKTANRIENVYHKPFKIAVQTKAKDTPTVGCQFRVKLTPKYFAKSLTENQYFQSLKRYGASSHLKLVPWLIQSSKCEPDFRSTLVRGMIHQITVAKNHPFTNEQIMFSEESSGIALGMLTGRAGWMDFKTKSLARSLGILHVFAASGLHLGIFYGVLFWPLSRLFGSKHGLATVPPLVVAAGYVWMLNFPISLVRAFFFCLFLRFVVLFIDESPQPIIY